MALRLGINGFGRIGRCVARAAAADPNVDLVAVNDLSDVNVLGHLFKYDSIHREFGGTVEVADSDLVINGDRVKVLAERDPAALPWGQLGCDVVLECTGIFRSRDKAAAHLQGGAKKVILSAPGKGEVDGTFVMGVNEKTYDAATQHVISNASCTTNCIAPLAKVLNDSFGLLNGLMTTIHSYTNDQALLDGIHKDWRRARAGAMSQVPTTTGAAKAVGLVLPELKGKLNGLAVRVPTPNVSLVDLVVTTERAVTVDSLKAAYKEAADGPLKGILQYLDVPLVSNDMIGNSYSCIFDAELTYTQGDHMAKLLAWYDNEWGYSVRLLDLARYVGERL
jgi:glyceraldehyde 3-phosphate dehydrogenase